MQLIPTGGGGGRGGRRRGRSGAAVSGGGAESKGFVHGLIATPVFLDAGNGFRIQIDDGGVTGEHVTRQVVYFAPNRLHHVPVNQQNTQQLTVILRYQLAYLTSSLGKQQHT